MIESAVTHLQEEVPALKKLKLVFGLDLRAKGDMQTYRVELPGPKVSKGRGEDERCRVEIDRQQFNQLADEKARSVPTGVPPKQVTSGSREIRMWRSWSSA